MRIGWRVAEALPVLGSVRLEKIFYERALIINLYLYLIAFLVDNKNGVVFTSDSGLSRVHNIILNSTVLFIGAAGALGGASLRSCLCSALYVWALVWMACHRLISSSFMGFLNYSLTNLTNGHTATSRVNILSLHIHTNIHTYTHIVAAL